MEKEIKGLARGDHDVVRGEWFGVAGILSDHGETMPSDGKEKLVVDGCIDDSEEIGLALFNQSGEGLCIQ